MELCTFGQGHINYKILKLFRKNAWKVFTDKYSEVDTPHLPVNEIVHVEPVAQPVAVATTTQPDYKKMKVADLKQLCKVRKIKGITGKSKEELIAMLTA